MKIRGFLIVLFILLTAVFFVRPLFNRPMPATNIRVESKAAKTKVPLPASEEPPSKAIYNYNIAFPSPEEIKEEAEKKVERDRRYEEETAKRDRERIRRSAGI